MQFRGRTAAELNELREQNEKELSEKHQKIVINSSSLDLQALTLYYRWWKQILEHFKRREMSWRIASEYSNKTTNGYLNVHFT